MGDVADDLTAEWLARNPEIAARRLEGRVGAAVMALFGESNALSPEPMTAESLAEAELVLRAVNDQMAEARRLRDGLRLAERMHRGST